jgi:hypothetical protein
MYLIINPIQGFLLREQSPLSEFNSRFSRAGFYGPWIPSMPNTVTKVRGHRFKAPIIFFSYVRL